MPLCSVEKVYGKSVHRAGGVKIVVRGTCAVGLLTVLIAAASWAFNVDVVAEKVEL